jgi:flagellar hook assembly protein FlgD
MVYFPADASQGTIAFYSESMELVYRSQQVTRKHLGRPVFAWDGTTDRGVNATTGIYVFVIQLPDRIVTGKLAVVNR